MIWLGIVVASFLLVGFYRYAAMRRRWFDIPNQRSSHTDVVPRGAGIVLGALISIAAIALSWRSGQLDIALGFALGIVVALAGWCDDLRGLSVRKRFLVYGVACLGAVGVVVGFDSFDVVTVFIVGLGALGMLWWVNLYNFMDGINGIAALEGIFICAAVYGLTVNVTATLEIHALQLSIVAVLVGFLPWNFPKARVFMGDAGSAFLGFVIGVIVLWSVHAEMMNIWQWLILGGVFIVDSSYTLCIRIVTGQRWHEAHRSHAYQRLADRYQSHVIAVGVVLAVNVIWLLPLAWAAGELPALSAWLLIGGYLPMLFVCYRLRAGAFQIAQ